MFGGSWVFGVGFFWSIAGFDGVRTRRVGAGGTRGADEHDNEGESASPTP